MEADLKELFDRQDVYGLRENAAKLADRSILLFGGWEDEGSLLISSSAAVPGAKECRCREGDFPVYHTDHEFSNVRQRLASDMAGWLLRD